MQTLRKRLDKVKVESYNSNSNAVSSLRFINVKITLTEIAILGITCNQRYHHGKNKIHLKSLIHKDQEPLS